MMRAMGSAWMTPFPSPASFHLLESVISPRLGGGLAQVSSSGGSSATAQSIALWAAAMIGAIVLGAVALFVLRRRFLGEDDSGHHEALSLHDLRQMHARSELSDEEFEAAKAALLGIAPPSDSRTSLPGFDLTGEPLPRRNVPPRIKDGGESSDH